MGVVGNSTRCHGSYDLGRLIFGLFIRDFLVAIDRAIVSVLADLLARHKKALALRSVSFAGSRMLESGLQIPPEQNAFQSWSTLDFSWPVIIHCSC